ncbi:hypothetical protein C0J52_01471 [Blattella germanica]|nr:hypothetical protein C0J52_01471 [Blattella germanica]
METLLIFVPCSLYEEEPGILYGIIQETKEKAIKAYYILGKTSTSDSSKDTIYKKRALGYYCENNLPSKHMLKHRRDWLILGLKNGEFVVYETPNTSDVKDEHQQTVCIIYDHKKFVKSEFLLQSSEFKSITYEDHFKTLAYTLTTDDSDSSRISSFLLKNVVSQTFVSLLLLVVSSLLQFINFLYPVLKYSSLGLHLQVFLKNLSWVLNSCVGRRRLSVKVGNYIIATAVDVCAGMLLLYWIIAMTSPPSQLLLDSGEVVVRSLRELLQWLMGIPAGLKLNYAFNNMLGRFFLYHINLWWTFLVVAKPLLEGMFFAFLWLGHLGLSFQAAILTDLLALVSFHVYCIYVYAARLYNLQVSGLVALSRLFLGRKHNPLRERVDSCHFLPDQLFVGTLAFTILLFLLPTTFMYYTVFTTLRLLVVGFGGLLIRLRYVLQCLPLYVTTLWLLQSTSISSTIHLTVQPQGSGGPLFLSVQPVAGSWWKTVEYCMPEPVQPPPHVEWGTMIGNLVSGRLIYPV